MPTQQERFEAALQRLRDQQITPTLILDDRAIVRSECLEAFAEAADMAGTHLWAGTSCEGGAWRDRRWIDRATAVQDTRLSVSRPGFGEPVAVEMLWVSYPHKLPDTASQIVDAFKAEGFVAVWDGDPYKSVGVRLT